MMAKIRRWFIRTDSERAREMRNQIREDCTVSNYGSDSTEREWRTHTRKSFICKQQKFDNEGRLCGKLFLIGGPLWGLRGNIDCGASLMPGRACKQRTRRMPGCREKKSIHSFVTSFPPPPELKETKRGCRSLCFLFSYYNCLYIYWCLLPVSQCNQVVFPKR